MSLPHFAFHIGDYHKDTGHLRTVEHGAYLLLMLHYYATGGLPDDDKQLATIARVSDREWRQYKQVLQSLFKGEGAWQHKRIEEELADAQARYERRALAGSEGGKAKARGSPKASNASQRSSNATPIASNALATDNRQPTEEDNAPSGAPPKFAFESGRIRLNAKNLSEWKRAFVNLDLEAELLSLSQWAESQGNNWFCAVSGALAKRNREVGIRKSAAQRGERVQPNGRPWPEAIT